MIEAYARTDPLEPATPFSIRASVIFGWEILRNNFSFLAGVAAITAFLYSLPPILIPMVDPVIRRVTHDDGLIVQLVNGFTALLDYSIAGLVSMGLIRVSLTFCNDQPAEFSELFSCYPLFFKFVSGTLLFAGMFVSLFLVACLGSVASAPLVTGQFDVVRVLFLAAAVVVATPITARLVDSQFIIHLIVDEGLGPWRALKKSISMARSVRWRLMMFNASSLGVVLAVGAGIIVALAMTGVLLGRKSVSPAENPLRTEFLYIFSVLITLPYVMAHTSVYRQLVAQPAWAVERGKNLFVIIVTGLLWLATFVLLGYLVAPILHPPVPHTP